MKLGLVCQTFSEEVRFRTLTRKRLLSLTPEQQRAKIRQVSRSEECDVRVLSVRHLRQGEFSIKPGRPPLVASRRRL